MSACLSLSLPLRLNANKPQFPWKHNQQVHGQVRLWVPCKVQQSLHLCWQNQRYISLSFPAARCWFPHISYGKIVSAARPPYKSGDTVSFVCNTGYTLQGSHTSTCQDNSRWSPPLPVCKKGKCPSVGGKLPLVSSQIWWESKARMHLSSSLLFSNQSAASLALKEAETERIWGGTWVLVLPALSWAPRGMGRG